MKSDRLVVRFLGISKEMKAPLYATSEFKSRLEKLFFFNSNIPALDLVEYA